MIKVATTHYRAKAPTRKHITDAGMDVYSINDVLIESMDVGVLSTGITVEVPKGFHIQIWPKSRSQFLIGGGIIDETYTGEILVKIFNPCKESLAIRSGDAIAQLVIVPVVTPEILEVPESEIHQDKEARQNDGIVRQKEILEELGYTLEIQDVNITQS